MSSHRRRRGPEASREDFQPPRSYPRRSRPAPSKETSADALDSTARCGRPAGWLPRDPLAPESSAWRRGTFRWNLFADPWKVAVPPAVFARAGFRARLRATCATAPRLAAGAPPSIAFQRAANRGAAPRSRLPVAPKVLAERQVGVLPPAQAWE